MSSAPRVLPAADVVVCPGCGSDDVGCWAGNDTDREDQADYFGCEVCDVAGVTAEYVTFVAGMLAREPEHVVRLAYGDEPVDAAFATLPRLDIGPVVLALSDEHGAALTVRLSRETDAAGRVYVSLGGVDCDLDGEAPGCYYVQRQTPQAGS
jgi:hypothetical protein